MIVELLPLDELVFAVALETTEWSEGDTRALTRLCNCSCERSRGPLCERKPLAEDREEPHSEAAGDEALYVDRKSVVLPSSTRVKLGRRLRDPVVDERDDSNVDRGLG